MEKSLVILISGRGSNMVRLAQCCVQQRWPSRIALVVSNEPDAPGLALARDLGLKTAVVPHRDFESREAFDQALADQIAPCQPDLIVLAGFMRILGATFVDRFAHRIINIHPALLPAFPGLDTHCRALNAGVAVHGATVHFVTAELDAGPIIAQAVVPVRAGDDADRLKARVQAAEHELYPAAVQSLLNGDLTLQGDRVVARDSSVRNALALFDES